MVESLVKNFALAWRPLAQIRERLASGTLNVGAVIAPCIAVIIASNLAVMSVYGSYMKAANQDNPSLIDNPVAQEVFTLLYIMPIAAIALLARRSFGSAGKEKTLGALFIVVTSFIFISSALLVLVILASTIAATTHPERGQNIKEAGAVVVALITYPYLAVIWFKAASMLMLSRLQAVKIAFVFVFSYIAILSAVLAMAWLLMA